MPGSTSMMIAIRHTMKGKIGFRQIFVFRALSRTSDSVSSTFSVRSSVYDYEKSHGRTYHAVSGAISSHRSSKHETKPDSITRAVSWTSSIMILLTKGEYHLPNDDVSMAPERSKAKADMMPHVQDEQERCGDQESRHFTSFAQPNFPHPGLT